MARLAAVETAGTEAAGTADPEPVDQARAVEKPDPMELAAGTDLDSVL